MTWNQIKNWTARDPLLSQVYLYTMQGWPRIVENDLLPYFRKKDEISTEGGCLAVIIPSGRADLHEDERLLDKCLQIVRRTPESIPASMGLA